MTGMTNQPRRIFGSIDRRPIVKWTRELAEAVRPAYIEAVKNGDEFMVWEGNEFKVKFIGDTLAFVDAYARPGSST